MGLSRAAGWLREVADGAGGGAEFPAERRGPGRLAVAVEFTEPREIE